MNQKPIAEEQEVVCPWCYNLTTIKTTNEHSCCKVCERIITEEDMHYEMLEED